MDQPEKQEAPSAAPAPVAPSEPLLVMIGLTAGEAAMARRAVCANLRAEGSAIRRALESVECARRTGGLGPAGGALLLDSEGHWGAATFVPPDYLVTQTAAFALSTELGLRQGAGPFQPVADCRLNGSAGDRAAAETEAMAASTSEAPDDEDAGMGQARNARVPAGAWHLPALMMRDGSGRFQVGLLVDDGALLTALPKGPMLPVGLSLLPGQLAHAGPRGAVLYVGQDEPDPAHNPAPAAFAYAAEVRGEGLANASVVLTSGGVNAGSNVPLDVFTPSKSACAPWEPAR